MKRQLVSTASCVLLLCVCLPISAFASINITSAQTYALVSNYNSYYDYSYALAGATTTVIIPGSPDFSATNSTLYGQSGFSHDTELEREGGEYDASEGYGLVKFTAVTNDSYSISGNFENSAGWGVSHAYLYDVTDNHLLFNSYVYALGPSTWDLAGFGLNGSLIAGHNYEWYFYTNNYVIYGGDDGATASGAGSIQFFSAVPEPSSLLIWGTLGLVGLVGRRRRKTCRMAVV